MCERTYWGCPNCGEPADSEMRSCELATERIEYHLDSDGDIDHNIEADYSEGAIEHEDEGYKCLACSWTGACLDDECSSEHCECDECVEPEPGDPGADPDRIVVLKRTADMFFDPSLVYDMSKFPLEILRLWANRATWFQPLPRWRAAEIYRAYANDWDDILGCVEIDFGFEMPDEAAYSLILPGFDPHKLDYKGAPDDGHVAACA
jgi:hypothetical protein